MSIIIISLFYFYYLIASNYYRRELHFRFIAYSKMTGKDKSPIAIKKLVIVFLVIVAVQIIFCYLFSSNALIIINTIPVIILMLHLKKMRKRIVIADINNQEE